MKAVRSLRRTHVLPSLGSRRVRDLSADDVDKWLAGKTGSCSTRTLQGLHSCLNRAIKRAMARDKVKRNVVVLCGVPRGQEGRPSKSLTLVQAGALLDAARGAPLGAYVVVSLLTGARTEELRALTWAHVDLDGQADAKPPVPPSVQVWRSVREGGDTKTKKSRRTLAISDRCVAALRTHQEKQQELRKKNSKTWHVDDLVFSTSSGAEMDSANVRRGFRSIARRAGLDAANWTPRELRHSFVSLLSDSGVSIETIADLMGHAGTRVTEAVYRKPRELHLTREKPQVTWWRSDRNSFSDLRATPA